jgi:hypothetical protein
MKKTWVKVKRGFITDPKHRRAIGIRIWLYQYMLDCVDWNDGVIYGWKDKDAADEMGMSYRTIQDQRQHLETAGYISCQQVLHGQDITIKNWTNPREYSGEVYNGTESSVPPKKAHGTVHGTVHGISKQRTSSYNSHTTKSIKPLSVWVKFFGNFPKRYDYVMDDDHGNVLEGNEMADTISRVHSAHSEIFMEVIEWSRAQDYKYYHSRVKAFDKAITNWNKNTFKKDTPENYDDELKDGGYERI